MRGEVCYASVMDNLQLRVPFYKNVPDKTWPEGGRCTQAAYRSILKYFLPDQDFSWEDLDEITGHKPEAATWGSAGLLWLAHHGFEVEHIALFDYQRFIEKGATYLQTFGPEVADYQIKHSDLPAEIQRARELIEAVKLSKAEPTIAQIEQALQDGFLVRCLINSFTLNNRPGYEGHSVVVTGFTTDGIVVHDPGLPPHENRPVKKADFETAWAYPNSMAKEMDLIKLRK